MKTSAPSRNLRPRSKAGRPAPLRRGARLPRFMHGPADADAKLGALRVGIVGVGSVGGQCALHLARLLVAGLWLVDGKSVKAESLATHEVSPGDVGKPKASVFGHRCRAISPVTIVETFVGRVEDLPLDAFADADIVIIATDNLAAELEVARRCRLLGKPMNPRDRPRRFPGGAGADLQQRRR